MAWSVIASVGLSWRLLNQEVLNQVAMRCGLLGEAARQMAITGAAPVPGNGTQTLAVVLKTREQVGCFFHE